MEELQLTPQQWHQLATAIVIWTGWERASSPTRRDSDVVRAFGAEAPALLLLIAQVNDVFNTSDAWRRASSLSDVAEFAKSDGHSKLPKLPRDALAALAWCYSFDYK